MASKSRRKKIRRQVRQQVREVEAQMELPLVEALVDIRADALNIVYTAGLKVVDAMLEEDRVRLCGPKHARDPERELTRAGTVNGEIVLGGRRVSVERPRVRRKNGGKKGEVSLPTYEALKREDPLADRAVEQMLIGVSTRKYERSLEPLPQEEKARGTSRSPVSRRFVAKTSAKLKEWQQRLLGDLNIVALMVDGIGFGDYTLVVALGIDATGKKHPLGLREGSTENATLCRELLADIVDRGIRADRAILVVIDGGKGLRKAVREVFGDYGVVQRCQVHKTRNVLEHLGGSQRAHAKNVLRQAYKASSSKTAKRQLESLARSLDEDHPSAAASLREGLDETLTILDLELSPALRRSLSSTNAIESMFSTVRRVSDRVTRWRSGTMALRWALAGIAEAEKKFRRLMGRRDMPKLVAALHDRDLKRSTTGRRRAA